MAHILVVDDEWRLREMLRILLEDAGHRVTSAAEGHAALREIDDHGLPDLIMLDLAMPGMDGWKVLDELYRSGRREQTRVLVVTGMDEAPDASPYVLRKPFDVETLITTVALTLAEPPEEAVARRTRLDGLTAVLRPVMGR